jgi:hypothetical protein
MCRSSESIYSQDAKVCAHASICAFFLVLLCRAISVLFNWTIVDPWANNLPVPARPRKTVPDADDTYREYSHECQVDEIAHSNLCRTQSWVRGRTSRKGTPTPGWGVVLQGLQAAARGNIDDSASEACHVYSHDSYAEGV